MSFNFDNKDRVELLGKDIDKILDRCKSKYYDQIQEIQINCDSGQLDINNKHKLKSDVSSEICKLIDYYNWNVAYCKNCKCNFEACYACIINKARHGFQNMIDGEKIVIALSDKVDSDQCPIKNVIMTNYGRYFRMDTINKDHIRNSNISYNEFNFWLSDDDIHLINLIHPNKVDFSLINRIKYSAAKQRLLTLYTKHLIRKCDKLEKYKDKIDEKAHSLKLEECDKFMDQLKKEREQFEQEKRKYYDAFSPIMNIAKEKEKLEEQKKKMQLMAKKLKLQKIQLDREKDAINSATLDDFEL